MTLTFASLGLQPTLLNTLNELDYDDPTPIQAQAIPLALSGKDILGQAQTGTGKTAAFTLPVLHQMSGYALQTLILAPTRELAIQVSQAVYQYSKGMDLKVLPVYGGTAYDRQIRRIKKGVQVIVGTPGRTLDLINKGILRLDDIRYVILDEADEMLRLGFIEDVESILSSVPKTNRQTLLFSATFSNPVLRLAQNYMQDPVHVEIEAEQVTADNIDQHYFVVRNADKVEALSRLLETETYQNVLVFTRTKVGSAELAQTLIDRGYPAVAIHGDLAQNERERILRGFRDGKLNVLVATDVVGRGVDLSDITHVINYDVPQLPIDYVHRIGRTGRAGRAGTAMTFITGKEHYRIKKIESFIETKISKAKLPTGEDVQTARDTRMRAKLVAHIDKVVQDGTDDFELIDSLLADGYDAEQIVSGMMAMLRAESNDYPIGEIRDVHQRSGETRREKRKRKRKSNNREKYDDANMVRLVMSVGKSSGVRPGDVVRSIASTAQIPGSSIGAIKIQRHKTFVDVPQTHVQAVLTKAKTAHVRGERAHVQRA